MAAKAKKKVHSNKKTKKQLTPAGRDILILIFLGVGILLFLSNMGFCGIVGVGIRYLLFGIFGITAFIFPICLFLLVLFILANSGKEGFVRILVSSVCIFILVDALCAIILAGFNPQASVAGIFLENAEQSNMGGGLLGGLVILALGKILGVAGTYIVIFVALFAFAILISGRALLSGAKDKTMDAIHSGQEAHEKRVQERKKELSKTREEQESQQVINIDLYHPSQEEKNRQPEIDFTNEEESAADELPFIPDSPATEEESVDDSIPVDMIPINSERETDAKDADIPGASDSLSPKPKVKRKYRIPPLSLLTKGAGGKKAALTSHVKETALILQQTLHSFGVEATVINASCGPTVTRYELQPEKGVKVSRIVNLTDDIKLNLAAEDIRIEAPIPGKAAIGIEVPNKTNNAVLLRDLLDSEEFKNSKSKISFAVGKDLAGRVVAFDIAKMPHLLIAGATGSGKSVCINTLIMSILYKATPDQVKFIMIDPKVVELSIYNGIPHLITPVVTDPKKATGALAWTVAEMTRRYNLFAEFQVRDIKGYNAKVESLEHFDNEQNPELERLPQIVVIVDELADLMMTSPTEVEDSICRIAQLARACGIHLVIATQRPSVNVITGLIKANMPSRIALSVTSGIDSRVILDMNGAEKLLGKGDMLFYPAGYQKPSRVQGGFVSDEEIQRVVEYISAEGVEYDKGVEEALNSYEKSDAKEDSIGGSERDVYFGDAGKFIIEKDKASIGMLQRVFKIGFNRAARIMDQLCEAHVVGEEEGTKPRQILMNMEQFCELLETGE